LKGRVLIIDDEAEIRRNLTFGLTQEDYSVVTCPDGISAIHELNQSRNKGLAYNYLITDIFMPDIDGLKILKVIKNQYPDLPVLVITGFGDERLMMTALAEYNTGFLNKPFEIPELVSLQDVGLILTLFFFVLITGIVLTYLSTWFAVKKYLRAHADQLYY